jgi:hypothetical protein
MQHLPRSLAPLTRSMHLQQLCCYLHLAHIFSPGALYNFCFSSFFKSRRLPSPTPLKQLYIFHEFIRLLIPLAWGTLAAARTVTLPPPAVAATVVLGLAEAFCSGLLQVVQAWFLLLPLHFAWRLCELQGSIF